MGGMCTEVALSGLLSFSPFEFICVYVCARVKFKNPSKNSQQGLFFLIYKNRFFKILNFLSFLFLFISYFSLFKMFFFFKLCSAICLI